MIIYLFRLTVERSEEGRGEGGQENGSEYEYREEDRLRKSAELSEFIPTIKFDLVTPYLANPE